MALLVKGAIAPDLRGLVQSIQVQALVRVSVFRPNQRER